MTARALAAVLVFLIALPALDAEAQDAPDGDPPMDNRLTMFGTVTKAQTGTPLPGAHVFVAGTMIGTVTDADGNYRLADVPRGTTRIHVSMIGFESAVYELFMRRSDEVRYDFQLKEDVMESEGVVVEAERDEKWQKNLDRFRTMFLGPSEWAEDCKIVNPEVLRFERTWWGKFDVTAAEPLVIDNRALGYRIEYFLHDFKKDQRLLRWKGEALFAELTPSSPAEAKTWATNRRKAYHGSLRHFLRALLQGRVNEEQFQISRLPKPGEQEADYLGPDTYNVTRNQILSVDADSVFQLDLSGTLRIVYTGEPESQEYVEFEKGGSRPKPVQTSTLSLSQPTLRIDRTGRPESAYALVVDGYFAFHRSTAMLPFEYVPEDESLYIGQQVPPLTPLTDDTPSPASTAPRATAVPSASP